LPMRSAAVGQPRSGISGSRRLMGNQVRYCVQAFSGSGRNAFHGIVSDSRINWPFLLKLGHSVMFILEACFPHSPSE